MCTHFQPTRNEHWVREHFGVGLPSEPYPEQGFPGYPAPIALLDGQKHITCAAARFGLVPHWAQDAKAATQIGRKTYNARIETVADKPSYRAPWRKRQFAIALLDSFYEPNWETGKAVRWRIQRADGQPMGVASIWDRWTDPASGEIVTSFSMLTVNADGHPVMGQFHRPGDEKRSVLVLEPQQFTAWLNPLNAQVQDMLQCPRQGLLVSASAPVVQITAQHGLFG